MISCRKSRGIVLIPFLVTSALAIAATILNASGHLVREHRAGVITEELQQEIDALSSDDKIPVYIWTEEIDSAEVEDLVFEQVGLNREYMDMMEDKIRFSLEDNGLYVHTEREIYAELQLEKHREFCLEHCNIAGLQEENEDSLFLSRYAPMICTRLTPFNRSFEFSIQYKLDVDV